MKKLIILITLSLFLQFNICLQLNVYAEEPSSWAVNEVNEAIKKGLVPTELQSNYNSNITREEFCKLCTAVMKVWNSNFQYKESAITFSDTNDRDIINCAELGIVSGIGNNKFAPDNPITRQEAAKMLYNTLNVATDVISQNHSQSTGYVPECCVPHSFDDGGDIRSWARNEITHMYRFGVMLGTENNKYKPENYYTREQAITAFLRLYNCNISISDNPVPEKEYYPFKDTVWDYTSDGHATILSFDYIKDDYIMNYIDSAGKRYTNEDLGYVYPPDWEYASVVVTVGTGVSRSVIINKKGDICLQELNDGRFYMADVIGKYANIIFPWDIDKGSYDAGVYDIESGEKVFDFVYDYDIGEGYFRYKKDGLMGVMDKNNNIIFKNEYMYVGRCYNDTFILENQDGSYSIAKTDGEIVKTFNVNENWEFEVSVGSNIIFAISFNEYILYNAYSEKQSDKFYDLLETDNGEFIAHTKNDDYIILDADGSVKFDISKEGYDAVWYIANGLYAAASYDDCLNFSDYEKTPFNIIEKNGNIIKKDLYKSYKLVTDKGGIFAYQNDNEILFFDSFGDDIGSFDLNDEVYYNNDTGEEEKIVEFSTRKFINGLLWIYGRSNEGHTYSKYVLPDGRSFTDWEIH